MSQHKIEFRNIYKVFGAKPLEGLQFVKNGGSKDDLLDQQNQTLGINNLSLAIEENEFFVIMGLSGSGKSTLIRHLNSLIGATDGSVLVDGQDVTHLKGDALLNFRRHKVSMVFQKFALLPHKTVKENIALGLRIRGEGKEEKNKKVQKWIDIVGLTGYEDSYPRQLSGGMQQRVGIARALAVETDILIMDEPFSALDPLIRAEMQDVVLGLKDKMKKTVVFVTHDLEEAVKLGDRMAILKDGELVQLGTPENIVNNPNCEYVSKFVEGITLT
jgi:glycine betaine/proline transport system ATP-binding protein